MASRRGVHIRRLDNIQHFVLIPYSPYGLRTYTPAADFIHAYGVIEMRRTRKECAETESWLKLLYNTKVIGRAYFIVLNKIDELDGTNERLLKYYKENIEKYIKV